MLFFRHTVFNGGHCSLLILGRGCTPIVSVFPYVVCVPEWLLRVKDTLFIYLLVVNVELRKKARKLNYISVGLTETSFERTLLSLIFVHYSMRLYKGTIWKRVDNVVKCVYEIIQATIFHLAVIFLLYLKYPNNAKNDICV